MTREDLLIHRAADEDAMPCKLTTQELTTYGGFQWAPGEWVETSGKGNLCGSGWIHYYDDPLLAVLFNPIHACIRDPLGWTIEIAGETRHDLGLKSGSTRVRLIEQVALPDVSLEERVCCAIAWARAVLPAGATPEWNAWATAYLCGDREASAAWAAESAAAWVAGAAWAAESAAARAAESAVMAAQAARAARAAEAGKLPLAQIAADTVAAERERVR